ncbi:hypothetical protein C5167_046805 [Papaver somniferum]|uniref:Uncharacterized protein n=1 Tax=Papaver somniferum TaxID=3469 RepID=A0A4Y7LIK2_PAPSO|nr:hypothetical protein C5167_046805 [Papaver somniferum]
MTQPNRQSCCYRWFNLVLSIHSQLTGEAVATGGCLQICIRR